MEETITKESNSAIVEVLRMLNKAPKHFALPSIMQVFSTLLWIICIHRFGHHFYVTQGLGLVVLYAIVLGAGFYLAHFIGLSIAAVWVGFYDQDFFGAVSLLSFLWQAVGVYLFYVDPAPPPLSPIREFITTYVGVSATLWVIATVLAFIYQKWFKRKALIVAESALNGNNNDNNLAIEYYYEPS